VSVASAERFMEGVERERQPSAERLAAWKAGLQRFGTVKRARCVGQFRGSSRGGLQRGSFVAGWRP
jgi:hypothetical protein